MEPAPLTDPKPASRPDAAAPSPDPVAPAPDPTAAPAGPAPSAAVASGPAASAPAAASDPAAASPAATAGSSASVEPAEEESPRLGRREGRSPRDMALSLAVLLVPIALLLIFYRVVLSGDAPITVDPAPTIQEAQQAALFTVAVPTGLGDDWHVSSATFTRQPTGATLRIGYVDPDKDPVQLIESSVPAATLLPAELGSDAKALGNVRTGAGVWRAYDARQGEKALVLAEPSRTIVVLGKTDTKNLQTMASSLK